ncbi:ADP-ribosylglycohydrolase family protein, partial [Micromonospora sp. DH15]|nr:ADP-ribosylglycohydrolase family protein [Micromonospora sp. DH15]
MITRVIDSSLRRASGSLLGLAYGDALGRPTEFLTVAEIHRRYGPAGPRELEGDPALVTDDTQMALAVAWALHDAPAYTPAAVEPLLRERFVAWSVSPDNNRAPGMTCLRACAELSRGVRWQEATVAGSKGCGANMRVTPVGLLAVDLDTLAGLAQLQAGLTHGHPTGLAA